MVDALLKTFNLGRESCRNIGDLLNAVQGGLHCQTYGGLATVLRMPAPSLMLASANSMSQLFVMRPGKTSDTMALQGYRQMRGSGFPGHVFS